MATERLPSPYLNPLPLGHWPQSLNMGRLVTPTKRYLMHKYNAYSTRNSPVIQIGTYKSRLTKRLQTCIATWLIPPSATAAVSQKYVASGDSVLRCVQSFHWDKRHTITGEQEARSPPATVKSVGRLYFSSACHVVSAEQLLWPVTQKPPCEFIYVSHLFMYIYLCSETYPGHNISRDFSLFEDVNHVFVNMVPY